MKSLPLARIKAATHFLSRLLDKQCSCRSIGLRLLSALILAMWVAGHTNKVEFTVPGMSHDACVGPVTHLCGITNTYSCASLCLMPCVSCVSLYVMPEKGRENNLIVDCKLKITKITMLQITVLQNRIRIYKFNKLYNTHQTIIWGHKHMHKSSWSKSHLSRCNVNMS